MTIDKQMLRKEHAIKTVFTSFFRGISFSFENLDPLIIEQMMTDSDIKSAIESIKMAIHNRVLNIVGKNETQINDLKKIYTNKLIDFDVINNIIDSKFYSHTIQELIYNENFDVIQIKNKPRDWFTLSFDTASESWVWMFNGKKLPDYKFLISINRYNENTPAGRSELESIYPYWKAKTEAFSHASDIVQKYGGIITWFVFNEDTSETELQDMVDGLANVQGGSVIPIPVKPNGIQQGLGKEFGFINTADLTSDIHQKLIDFCKNQITEYLLGNSLIQRQGSTGSFASTQTANEIRSEYVVAYASYIIKNLNVLFDYQSIIHGDNNTNISFILNVPDDVLRIEDIKNKKLANLKIVKDIGYSVTAEYLSQEIGIPIEALYDNPQAATPLQFAKQLKKKDLFRINADKFWEQLLGVEDVIKEISNIYKEQFDNIKTETDIANISANLSNTKLDEMITLSILRGMFDVNEENIKSAEFAKDDEFSFNMKFNEAMSYLNNKQPEIFSNIDTVNKQVADKMFWIKKSTDLQATTKMQKSLIKTLQSGGTFKQWKDDIQKEADKQGFGKDGYYLKNVFRTNILTAYNSGRQEQQIKNIAFTPYWQYDAIDDDRTSEICSILNGKIYKANDPVWDKIYPPNHFQCRSGVIALDKDEFEEAKNNGYQLESSSSLKTQNVLDLLIENGFDNSPGNQAEAAVMMDINSKTYDIVTQAIATGTITNAQRYDLLKELMEDMHPNSGAGQKIIMPKNANGSMVSSYQGREIVHHIELNSKDTRPVEYKLVTIFHEITHFRKHGQEGLDEYEHGISKTDKHRLEEIMADMMAIYLNKKYTNIQTIPAYTEEISNAMAYLKRTKDFTNAKTVEDIGETFYNKYYLTKKSLIPLSKEIEDMRNADYRKLTDEEKLAKGSTLFDYKLKEDAGFVVYQNSLRKRLEDPEHKAAVAKLVARKYNTTEDIVLRDIDSGKGRNLDLYEVASMIIGGI